MLALLLLCLVATPILGQDETCQDSLEYPTIVFLRPLHDTSISIVAGGKVETKLLICGLSEQNANEIILYLNSNIVHREKASHGVVDK